MIVYTIQKCKSFIIHKKNIESPNRIHILFVGKYIFIEVAFLNDQTVSNQLYCK